MKLKRLFLAALAAFGPFVLANPCHAAWTTVLSLNQKPTALVDGTACTFRLKLKDAADPVNSFKYVYQRNFRRISDGTDYTAQIIRFDLDTTAIYDLSFAGHLSASSYTIGQDFGYRLGREGSITLTFASFSQTGAAPSVTLYQPSVSYQITNSGFSYHQNTSFTSSYLSLIELQKNCA